MGRKLLVSVGSPSFWRGVTKATFHANGTDDCKIDKLYKYVIWVGKAKKASFRIFEDRLSTADDLEISISYINFTTSSGINGVMLKWVE